MESSLLGDSNSRFDIPRCDVPLKSLQVEKTKSSATPLPALAYAAALRIAESVEELSEHARLLVGSQAPDWQFTLRIGITTGPALHGLLKTSTLINPDVVGAAVCSPSSALMMQYKLQMKYHINFM
ncbi:hypothetical protein Pelo_19870 [Pelomyxa schiedti]|nr:hypothetical protein Pelo_19870 [Pelomyxa schiedti]